METEITERKSLRGALVTEVMVRFFEEVVFTEVGDYFALLESLQKNLDLHLAFKTEITSTTYTLDSISGFIAFESEVSQKSVINFDIRPNMK